MDDAILIAILVIVCLILLFQVELYRNVLGILVYYSPEAPPPNELLFNSFFSTDSAPTNKK